jgi:PPE-repeat protein
MDFAFFPPEINSTRMYAGPGSGSLLAAAGSWDSLSAELGITAETYQSVLSCLTSLYWQGPAAQSMSATAAPYIAWLHTTAEQTMQTAMQARAAAAAYELAYAMTVPPLAVAANRTQLATLVATNFFGQNTPAIAQTEAQYGEYWAQDAAAMYGYAANAAAATRLTSFSSSQQTTNPAGLTDQNAAVAAANTSTTASVSQTVAAAPTAAADSILPADLTLQDGFLLGAASTDSITSVEEFVQETIGAMNDLRILPRAGAAALTDLAPVVPAAPQLGGAASSLAGEAGLGDVAATLARADTIGRMSVPASWTAPSGGPMTALSGGAIPTLEETGELARPGPGTAGVPGVPGVTASRATGVVPRYGARVTVMARPPAAG